MVICPKCGVENDDDWPLIIDGEVKEGGCQDCFEAECDKSWWLAHEQAGKVEDGQ